MAFLAVAAAAAAASGTAATVATVASAAIAAASAASQADAQRRAAHTAADADKVNAGIALEQGAAREAATRRQSSQALGRQAASIAQSGVDPTSGSALQVASDSATNAELQALNVRYGAAEQARGYSGQAAAENAAADNAMSNGYVRGTAGVVSSIVGGYGATTRPTTLGDSSIYPG